MRRSAALAVMVAFAVTAGASGCGSSGRPPTTAAGSSPAPSPVAADGQGRLSAHPSPSPSADSGACTIFPADNVWHAEVSKLPVHRDSAAWVASIGASAHAHPDFGAGLIDGAPFGIPVTTVGAGQATVKVTFDYADESDKGPYPV